MSLFISRRASVVVIFNVLLLLTPSIHATDDLYHATVVVADQSGNIRNTALKQALVQTIIKLTGNRNTQQYEQALRILTANLNRFVRQFHYQSLEDGASQDDRFLLQVQFDPVSLDKALRSHGLYIWSKQRPKILLWFVVEEDGRRYLNSSEHHADYFEILTTRAVLRGVNIIFPLMDITDRANLKVSDVWGGFEKQIRHASARYNPDVVLVGKISLEKPDAWLGTWIAYTQDDVLGWNFQDAKSEGVFENGIDTLVDRLVAMYQSTTKEESGAILLKISNLNSFDAFVQLRTYVESLSSVKQIKVFEIAEGEVVFDVEHYGKSTFKKELSNMKSLELLSDEVFHYRLR